MVPDTTILFSWSHTPSNKICNAEEDHFDALWQSKNINKAITHQWWEVTHLTISPCLIYFRVFRSILCLHFVSEQGLNASVLMLCFVLKNYKSYVFDCLCFQILNFSKQMEVMDHKVIGFVTILQFERLKIVYRGLSLNRIKNRSKRANQMKKTEKDMSFRQRSSCCLRKTTYHSSILCKTTCRMGWYLAQSFGKNDMLFYLIFKATCRLTH